MNYLSRDIYKHYIECGGELPYTEFREIICTFNEDVIDQILDGRELNMGKGLSRLSIMRIERDFKRPTIDWGSSNKLKEELLAEGEELFSKDNSDGTKWFVYFTDDWYLRFYWEKKRCSLKNRSAYRLDITFDNKNHLKRLIKKDSLAYLNFRTRGQA